MSVSKHILRSSTKTISAPALQYSSYLFFAVIVLLTISSIAVAIESPRPKIGTLNLKSPPETSRQCRNHCRAAVFVVMQVLTIMLSFNWMLLVFYWICTGDWKYIYVALSSGSHNIEATIMKTVFAHHLVSLHVHMAIWRLPIWRLSIVGLISASWVMTTTIAPSLWAPCTFHIIFIVKRLRVICTVHACGRKASSTVPDYRLGSVASG